MLKRAMRRTVGAAVGLMLGWLAAGAVYPPGTLAAATLGSDAKPGHHAGHDDDHHMDAGQQAARQLAPIDDHGHAATPAWFSRVVTGIAVLFGAAILIGVPALAMRGADPGSQASAEDQAAARHDDHGHGDGHGDHGHAAPSHH